MKFGNTVTIVAAAAVSLAGSPANAMTMQEDPNLNCWTSSAQTKGEYNKSVTAQCGATGQVVSCGWMSFGPNNGQSTAFIDEDMNGCTANVKGNFDGEFGVVARCCHMPIGTSYYYANRKSKSNEVETKCKKDFQAIGCAVKDNDERKLFASEKSSDFEGCTAHRYGRGPAIGTATCMKAPGLVCKTVTGAVSESVSTASCIELGGDKPWVATSCGASSWNVQVADIKAQEGTKEFVREMRFITDDISPTCSVTNDPEGSPGVQAQVTCCYVEETPESSQ